MSTAIPQLVVAVVIHPAYPSMVLTIPEGAVWRLPKFAPERGVDLVKTVSRKLLMYGVTTTQTPRVPVEEPVILDDFGVPTLVTVIEYARLDPGKYNGATFMSYKTLLKPESYQKSNYKFLWSAGLL